MLNWLKVFIISLLLIGCNQGAELEQCEAPPTNYDSLFSIGDSVLVDFYIQQAQQKLYHDSLTGTLTDYEIKLQQKQVKEERERIIYRDTIIYRKEFKTLYTTLTDTIRDTVYVTDTIRDTIYVKTKKKRRWR